MKFLKYILGLLIVGSLTGCFDDDFDFDYNPNAAAPIVQGFIGPADASANNVTEYEYNVAPRGGSTYAFTVVGATTASITPVTGRPNAVDIIFSESPVDLDAYVTVVETAANGKSSAVDSVSVTVSAYCSYNAQTLIGNLPGMDGRNGADYVSQAVVSSGGSDALFGITGLAFEWMFDYWGETITSSEVVNMELDPLGLFITIPEQDYLTTLWNGAPYSYKIAGTGLVNACTGDITITYTLENVSGEFVATLTFP
jgi:hypothetical protein